MSQEESEEAVRRALKAFNHADERSIAAIDECDPEIAIRDHPRLPDAQWHQGHRGVEKWAGKLFATFGAIRFDPVEFVHLSESRFIVRVLVSMTGKTSGAALPNFESFEDVTMRNGKVLRLEIFETLDDALEAAGVSE
jgi:hypothetical protein